jgi:hypothetical protein
MKRLARLDLIVYLFVVLVAGFLFFLTSFMLKMEDFSWYSCFLPWMNIFLVLGLVLVFKLKENRILNSFPSVDKVCFNDSKSKNEEEKERGIDMAIDEKLLSRFFECSTEPLKKIRKSFLAVCVAFIDDKFLIVAQYDKSDRVSRLLENAMQEILRANTKTMSQFELDFIACTNEFEGNHKIIEYIKGDIFEMTCNGEWNKLS